MEIYGESQIVEVPTYTHVGYLATAVYMPNFTLFYIGILVFLVGIIVVAQQLVKNINKSFLSIFKAHKKQMIVGFTILVIGVVTCILSFVPFGGMMWQHPEEITRINMRAIGDSLLNFQKENLLQVKKGKISTDFKEAMKTIGYNGHGLDAWDNPMSIKTSEYKGKTIYHVVSAGEDEKFGTEDDIDYPGYEVESLDRYLAKLHPKPDDNKEKLTDSES